MIRYPIEIQEFLDDEGNTNYYAFHPDFGHSACSAVGDTVEEAIYILGMVRRDVIEYYLETGREIPEPSTLSFLTELSE